MSSAKIFVVYHKPYTVFKNSVFEPIQTGLDFTDCKLGFLTDNTKDNIAAKNPWYGELTAWYWVAHNWIPSHPSIQHIGFCHYRRILDIAKRANCFTPAFSICPHEHFSRLFASEQFEERRITRILNKYDLVLPPKTDFMSFQYNFAYNLFQQYCLTHPRLDIEQAITLYLNRNPKNYHLLRKFWSGSSFYSCLNFVMRKDLFLELSNWMFSFLNELSSLCNWESYSDYLSIRTPAFIAERFFNLWLSEHKGLKIRHCRRWLLDGTPSPCDIPWYLSGI